MLDIIFIFCIYSILGWILETLYFFFKTGKIVKRGILHGAYCPLYGFSIATCTAISIGFKNNLFMLFLLCGVICTLYEFITAIFFDKVLHKKMWDYSGRKFSLLGYICPQFSAIWGVLGAFSIRYLNPYFLKSSASSTTLKIILSAAILIFMALDIASFVKIKNKSVDI